MPIIGLDASCAASPLLTERLALRPLRRADIPAIVRFAGDRDVAAMTARIPHPYTEADAEAWLGAVAAGHARGDELTFAMTGRDDGGFMGAIGLRVDRVAGGGVLGYWLARPYWNQGLVSEAARRILRFGFETLSLARIQASARPDNPASLRVLEKIGMAPAGRGVEEAPARGGPITVELRRVGRADWLAGHALPVVLVAAAALLDADDRVLLSQRPPGKSMAGLWEFPGGKVAPGETPEAALLRELREELSIETAESCLAPISFASHRYADFHLLMPLFVCRVWEGAPRAVEGQRLAWCRMSEVRKFPMPAADIGLVAALRDLL